MHEIWWLLNFGNKSYKVALHIEHQSIQLIKSRAELGWHVYITDFCAKLNFLRGILFVSHSRGAVRILRQHT
jgi:hypothetical protein